MNSFEIKIEVKRPRKIYKVMDYLIMFGVVIVAAVLIIFMPFIAKENEKAEALESVNIATSRLDQLKRNEQEITKNSESDTQYYNNHTVIDESIEPVHDYLQSLNDFVEHYVLLDDNSPRYTLLSQTVNGNVILLSVVDNGPTNMIFEFKQALLDNPKFYYTTAGGILSPKPIDLSWISDVVMSSTMSSNTISLEVYYGK